MGKIPKGLSDKAMIQGFEEEATLEDCFLAHEAHEEEKRRRAVREKELDLFAEGIKNYRIDIKREGTTIMLAPKETKGR